MRIVWRYNYVTYIYICMYVCVYIHVLYISTYTHYYIHLEVSWNGGTPKSSSGPRANGHWIRRWRRRRRKRGLRRLRLVAPKVIHPTYNPNSKVTWLNLEPMEGLDLPQISVFGVSEGRFSKVGVSTNGIRTISSCRVCVKTSKSWI